MKPYSQLTIVSYLIGPALIVVSHLGTLLVLFTGLSWGAIAGQCCSMPPVCLPRLAFIIAC